MQIPYRKPGKYAQMKADPLLTEEKFLKLKQKLERLKASGPAAAAEVAQTAQQGDFSENAEYQHAKGRLRGINFGILSLEHQLNNAEIIKPQKQTGTVQVGHKVTVEIANKQKTYQILGATETNPRQGVISHNSPLGAALIGRKVGEKVKVKLEKGETEYKIVKILT